MKLLKTNVMRIIEAHNIEYKYYTYDNSYTDGVSVARTLNQNEKQVFKTLVTKGKDNYYVFMIPVAEELDLKKAASAVNEKSISMLPQKELLPLTGYIHGGCSPIGMKKQFITVIDKTANNFKTIIFSGGKVGYQVELKLSDLCQIIDIVFYELTKKRM